MAGEFIARGDLEALGRLDVYCVAGSGCGFDVEDCLLSSCIGWWLA